MHLLIVDDHPEEFRPLRDALQADGHRVTESSAALAVLQGEAVDAVIQSAARTAQLEQRSGELRQGMESLQAAHEQIRSLNLSLERRLEICTAAAATANRELDGFAFSVSHDLRAPLRHMSGFAQLLDESAGVELTGENREFLTHILTAAKRMDGLIDALLEFARASRVELDLEEVDLDTLLEEALASLESDMKDRHIQWIRARLPSVRGDAAQLRNVLVNLLSNALKFSRDRDPAVIEIGTRWGRRGEVVVFVRDNGVGFDLQYAERLFGVFQRMHRANQFEGAGIGLANVRRIITRHGGAIWADAAVDHGATFSFSLPSAADPLDTALI